MNTPDKVQFEPRWKEELLCSIDGHTFIVEMTMGVLTVYMPTKSKWEQIAPEWAKSHWQRIITDLSAWCDAEKIPLKYDDNAWASFNQ